MTRPGVPAIRDAFEEFLNRGARGRDWPAWAALFTDDAVYTEHCMGQFRGSAGIDAWIRSAMEPVACMTFSVEWCAIEGDLLAFWIWNHLPTPLGTDNEFCFPNLSVLTYAGDGRWSAEEDFYAPAWTRCVVDWFRAGGFPAMAADPSLVPRARSHPSAPSIGPERVVVSAALSALSPPGSDMRHEIIEGAVGVGVFDTDVRAYAVVVHVDSDGTTVFSDVISNPDETINPCR